MNIELRPITINDYRVFFNAKPERTIKGFGFWLGGDLVAIFGAWLHKDTTMLFSDMKPDIDVPKITIYRWAKKALRLIDDMKQPLYATTTQSGKFLNSLGFRFIGHTKCGKFIYEYMG